MRADRTLRRVAVIAAMILGVSAAPSAGQTLADALVYTYKSNPRLISSRAQLRQADERVAQAQSELLPDLTGSLTGTLNNEAPGGFDPGNADERGTLSGDARITGTVTLWSGGRNPARIQAAVASVMAARARLRATEQDVLLDAVTAYMDVRRDMQFVALARNNVRVIGEQLRATRDRFEVGEVTRTDVSQAEAALAAARANLARNTGALAQSRAQFLAVTGLKAANLSPPPPIPALPRTLAEAEALGRREHPALEASRYNEKAASYEVELARAGLNPLLTLTGSVFYQRTDTLYRNSDTRFGARDNATNDLFGSEIQLQLQVPLYRGGELDSIVRQAREIVNQRKAETQDTARSVVRAVQNAWSGLRVARASIVANTEQVRAQRVAFEGVVEEAKFGERTTLDVLDAEQALLTARSNLVSSQRDAYVAAYNLLSAMGLLNVTHLGLGVDPYDPNEYHEYVRHNPPNPDGLRLERILDRWGG
ncbi:MAG: transporter [Alphaproteobacteria bacterium]|nr:MAG: transporter [Alphaproteobacteria bacterium]